MQYLVENIIFHMKNINNVINVKVVDVHQVIMHKNVILVQELDGYFIKMVEVKWKLNVIIVMVGEKL